MLVKEIMTKNVITIREEETIKNAFKKILENNITGAPVLNKQGKVIGIISEKDVLRIAKKFSKKKVFNITPFSFIQKFKEFIEEDIYEILIDTKVIDEISKISVKEAMTKEVIFVSENETVENVAKLMQTKKINRVPIIENEKLVGIATRSDILKALVK